MKKAPALAALFLGLAAGFNAAAFAADDTAPAAPTAADRCMDDAVNNLANSLMGSDPMKLSPGNVATLVQSCQGKTHSAVTDPQKYSNAMVAPRHN